MSQKIQNLKLKYNECLVEHNWQQALKIIEQMIAIEPQAKFYCKQGALLFRCKLYQKSGDSFRKAIELDSDNKNAITFLKKLEKKNVSYTQDDELLSIVGDVLQQVNNTDTEEKTINDISSKPKQVVSRITFSTETQETVVDTRQDPQTNLSNETLVASPSIIIENGNEENDYFGRYELQEKIGSGGMGHVYKIYDPVLDRTLALKILNLSLNTEEGRNRFMREARATAKLNHPHIICVHDIGEHNDRNFFTMDYIEGYSFKEYYTREKVTIKNILHLFMQVCDAIHYAHEQNVIHRDIKPSNIMIKNDISAKVMDFGLAKILHADDQISRTGQQMGTPAYMSPEQADGAAIDIRTDVYSLGATLYEALTKRPPFQGENHFNIIYQLHYKDPVALRLMNPDISVELEAICLKCLEKSSAHRYATVKDLRDDLDNMLHHRPIKAKPATSVKKTWKWIKRHKVASITTLLLVVFISAAAAFCLFQWNKTLQANYTIADKSVNILLSRAKEQLTKSYWREAGALAGEALEITQEHPQHMQSLKQNALTITRSALHGMGLVWETAVKDNHSLKRIDLPEEIAQYMTTVDLIDIHPGGKIVAVGCKSGAVNLYNINDGAFIRTLYQNTDSNYTSVTALAFHPNKSTLAVGNCEGEISLWNIYSGKIIRTIKQHRNIVSAIKFDNQGKLLATTSLDKTLKVYDLDKKNNRVSFQHSKSISSMDFDGKNHLACISGTEILFYFLSASKQQDKNYIFDTLYIPQTAVSYNHDGSLLAIGSRKNTIMLYDCKNRKLLTEVSGHSSSVSSLEFNGDLLVSGAADGEIIFWDVSHRKPIRKFIADDKAVQGIALHPDGRQIVSISQHGILRLWHLSSQKLLTKLHHNNKVVTSIAFAPDGKQFVSANKNGEILLWDYKSLSLQGKLNHQAKVTTANYNSDGSLLVTCGYDLKIKIWNTSSLELIEEIAIHNSIISTVQFSPDDKYLLSAASDATAKVWDIKAKKVIKEITGKLPFFNAAYSHDGKKIVLISEDILVLNTQNYREIHRLSGHRNWFARAFFSPDGKLIASSSGDSTVRIWNAETGTLIHTLRYNAWVWRLTFLHDSNIIACSCSDGKIRIIDATSGIHLHTLHFPQIENIFALAFHPQDKVLVSSSTDPTINLWSFETNWSYPNNPRWIKNRVTFEKPNLQFNFRRDINGGTIFRLLNESPSALCHQLFGVHVNSKNFAITTKTHLRNTNVRAFDPKTTQNCLKTGKMYYQKNPRLALDHLQMAITLNPVKSLKWIRKNAPEMQQELAQIFYERATNTGGLDQAIDLINIAIQLSPQGQFYFTQGKIYYEHQQWGKAKENFTKAWQKNPKFKKLIPTQG
ncbi:protein kinase [Candidatus Uabimicrobium sp. HlEnr_7]|uniref:protein kinase domain-containing protein n=1 Tax=Candidatus Uabimicrobium helgolandensis TaxID=3095367 RepID=UPI003558ADEB